MEIAGSSGDYFEKDEWLDHWVLFIGLERVETSTAYGDTTATECQLIIAFDENLAPAGVYEGLVFGALGKSAYNNKAQARLGKIIKVNYEKGEGWGLEDPDDETKGAIDIWAKDAIEESNGRYSIKPATNPDEKPFI